MREGSFLTPRARLCCHYGETVILGQGIPVPLPESARQKETQPDRKRKSVRAPSDRLPGIVAQSVLELNVNNHT